MLRNVALKSLRDARRGFMWWSLGLVALVALTVAFYPSVHDEPGLNKLLQSYPESVKTLISFGGPLDFTSPAGYLGTRLFSFMVPLLLLIAAIGGGAGALAGEEERGTLELLLANPISRRRLVLEKSAAVALEVVALGVVLWLALWVSARAVDMEIAASHLAAATGSAVLLALVYGALALMLGAATGRRSLAVGVTAAAGVAAYFVNALAPLVESLDFLRRLSPYYYYAAADPLRHGLDLGHALVLAAAAAAATMVAPVAFAGRDLSA
jgi:ABC-2 type transport system permease protein